MSDLTGGIDSYFWLTIATIFFGSIGVFIRYAYKSKCKNIECGCIKIERDIEAEEREDALALSLKRLSSSPSSPKNGII
jgi:hypothetical protein